MQDRMNENVDEAEVIDNIIKMPDLNYVPSEYGMGYEIFHSMKKYQNLVAQIDGHTEEEDTFESLLQRSIRTAIELKSRGVTSNDIVCLCSYNHLNSCIPYIAGLFIGTTLCALDPSMSYSDSKHLLSQVQPKIIFTVPEKRDLYQQLLDDIELKTELVIFEDETEDSGSFLSFLRESSDEDDFEPVKVDNVNDTALIMFSSGTTGLAKGICLSHYAVLYQAKNLELFGYNTYRTLMYFPLYWISSVVVFIQSILCGTARVLCKSFDPLEAWQKIEKFEITFMFIAPVQGIGMIKVGRPDNINTTSFLDLLIGGGPISSENLLYLRDLLPGTNVFICFGQTEIAGVGTTFRTNLRKDIFLLHAKPKSCGRPIPGFSYKIVDVDTEEVLSYNQEGELRIKSDSIFTNYYNMDSSEVWDDDGWMKTGDIAYYEEDLCFYIVDRMKEMLKFQSWHIAPTLLEGILQEHPAVKNAVVIGKPHDEDGEHPLGVVILMEDADVTPDELVEYVNSRLDDDRQKLRGGVIFVKDIPYTPSGKVKRRLLKERMLAEMSISFES